MMRRSAVSQTADLMALIWSQGAEQGPAAPPLAPDRAD